MSRLVKQTLSSGVGGLRNKSHSVIASWWTQSTRTMSKDCGGKAITIDNLNPNIINLQYAVRGPLVTRAIEIEKELDKGSKKPFKRVIKANIGDAHAMDQKPISYIRDLLACLVKPQLMESNTFPVDVQERAKEIGKALGGGSVGAYTMSNGVELLRRDVAKFIERRDGHPCDWNNVTLSAGASTAIKNVLQLFCNKVDGKPSGVMIPIPQYPLYSASLAEYGLAQVQYYLNEENNWSLDIDELERSYCEMAEKVAVRAIVVINPGNPTGQVLTRKNIEDIIKFAKQKKMFILADEVYQDNVYDPNSKFYSFKKVLVEMGEDYKSVELASFNSASKGFIGECGLRAGWMELYQVDPQVQAMLYKCISAMLCPSAVGQACIGALARPPVEGEPSYDLYIKEKRQVLGALNKRAKMIAEAFNSMEGYKCNIVQGAMYAFPSISLPPKAIEAAKAKGQPADVFYAFKLLEEAGICVVPGSGFGQRPNTYHFRTTILPQPELLQEMCDIFRDFHAKFMKEFA